MGNSSSASAKEAKGSSRPESSIAPTPENTATVSDSAVSKKRLETNNQLLRDLRLHLIELEKALHQTGLAQNEVSAKNQTHAEELQKSKKAAFIYWISIAVQLLGCAAMAWYFVKFNLSPADESAAAAFSSAAAAHRGEEEELAVVTGEEFLAHYAAAGGDEAMGKGLAAAFAATAFDYRTAMILVLRSVAPELTVGFALAALGLLTTFVSMAFLCLWEWKDMTWKQRTLASTLYTFASILCGKYLWDTNDANLMVVGGWFFFWGLASSTIVFLLLLPADLKDYGAQSKSFVFATVGLFPSFVGLPLLFKFPFGPLLGLIACGHVFVIVTLTEAFFPNKNQNTSKDLLYGVICLVFGFAYTTLSDEVEAWLESSTANALPEIFTLSSISTTVGALFLAAALALLLLLVPQAGRRGAVPTVGAALAYGVSNAALLYYSLKTHKFVLASVGLCGITIASFLLNPSLFSKKKKTDKDVNAGAYLGCVVANLAQLFIPTLLDKDLYMTFGFLEGVARFFLGPAGVLVLTMVSLLAADNTTIIIVLANAMMIAISVAHQQQVALVVGLLNIFLLGARLGCGSCASGNIGVGFLILVVVPLMLMFGGPSVVEIFTG